MENPDRALTGGMFLQVDLLLEERERLAVPESALSVLGDVTRLLTVQDGAAAWTSIEIGQQAEGLVEVISGIEPETQIIVSNLHRVQPGTEITATLRQQSADSAPVTGADG